MFDMFCKDRVFPCIHRTFHATRELHRTQICIHISGEGVLVTHGLPPTRVGPRGVAATTTQRPWPQKWSQEPALGSGDDPGAFSNFPVIFLGTKGTLDVNLNDVFLIAHDYSRKIEKG